MDIEKLKFSLAEKTSELATLSLNTFTLNDRVRELTLEIKELKDKIAALEKED